MNETKDIELAISVGNKLFRTYTKSNKNYFDMFPSYRHVAVCNFIYDLTNMAEVKNRAPMPTEKVLRSETMHAIFTYYKVTSFREVLRFIEEEYEITRSYGAPLPLNYG